MWCSSRPQPRQVTTWSSCSDAWRPPCQAWSRQRPRRMTWRMSSWRTLRCQSSRWSRDVLAEQCYNLSEHSYKTFRYSKDCESSSSKWHPRDTKIFCEIFRLRVRSLLHSTLHLCFSTLLHSIIWLQHKDHVRCETLLLVDAKNTSFTSPFGFGYKSRKYCFAHSNLDSRCHLHWVIGFM